MIQVVDPARFNAFVQLMSLPDPADLPHRGHVLRCEGDPDRRATRLPPILMGWLQRRYLETDVEEAPAAARRAARRHGRTYLQVLRPTGTED